MRSCYCADRGQSSEENVYHRDFVRREGALLRATRANQLDCFRARRLDTTGQKPWAMMVAGFTSQGLWPLAANGCSVVLTSRGQGALLPAGWN